MPRFIRHPASELVGALELYNAFDDYTKIINFRLKIAYFITILKG